MDKYRKVTEDPFYSRPATGVSLFRALSTERSSLPVVIKQHDIRYSQTTDQDISQAINAALAQAKVQHPHSCDILEVQVELHQEGCSVYHVLEAMDADVQADIVQRQRRGQNYTESELREFIVQTTSALAYAQEKGIAHRDIKPSNIYRSGDTYKVGDFGSFFIKKISSIAETYEGTPYYMSPQVRRAIIPEEAYNAFKADVFALGASLWEMISLSPPTVLRDAENLDETVRTEVGGLQCSQEIQGLLRAVLAFDEAERPTMQQIHDYVNTLPEEAPELLPLFYVEPTQVKVFNLTDSTWLSFPLSSEILVGSRSQYICTDAGLLCTGGERNGILKTAYLLQWGETWRVEILPHMLYPRYGHGLWWEESTHTVYAFGGFSLYAIPTRGCEFLHYPGSWQETPNSMRKARASTTPCEYRNYVYLYGLHAKEIEAFNPRNLTFLNMFHVLPMTEGWISGCYIFVDADQLVILSSLKVCRWGGSGPLLDLLWEQDHPHCPVECNMPPILDSAKKVIYVACEGVCVSISLDGSQTLTLTT